MKLLALIRSLLFYLAVLITTPVFGTLALLTFPFAPLTRYRLITLWTHTTLWLLRYVTGIRFRVIGGENIPGRPAVVLCKHQSAWETMGLQQVFPPQVYVLKKELMRIPFLGWGFAMLPMISIDRKAGRDALAQVVEQGKDRLAKGFWVVVFPEGTRVAPGEKKRYKAGGAFLAAQAGVPVVPVAHNAGELWPRNSILKYPGTITVSVGPAIDPNGLSADEINLRAETWIETEMRRISPHRYPDPHAQLARRTAA